MLIEKLRYRIQEKKGITAVLGILAVLTVLNLAHEDRSFNLEKEISAAIAMLSLPEGIREAQANLLQEVKDGTWIIFPYPPTPQR